MASRRRENPYLYPKGQDPRGNSKEGFKYITKKTQEDEEMALYKQMLDQSGL